MEFVDLENKSTQDNNAMQTQEPTLQETINNQTCEKPIKPQIEPIMTDRNSIRAETLINLTSHFYKLFKDKGVIDRFEPFLKDCKEQAMQRVNINEMLIFKDLEVPDSDFDSDMGVIPNEPPITENENTIPKTDSQDESANKEDSETQEPDAESEVLPPDTEAEKDKDKAQGSDVIVSTEIGLRPL